MSKAVENRLTRLERSLGLAEEAGDPEVDPDRVARGRAALVRLLETKLDGRHMTADELAALDARLAARPATTLSSLAQVALQRRMAGLGSEVSLLPLDQDGWRRDTPFN